MTTEEELYHRIASSIPEAEKSQMFGKPCYKLGGKAFCCFFQNEMVFKLSGASHHMALGLDGAKLFDPSGKGRPMKEWVQVPADHRSHWEEFAGDASAHVQGRP